MSADKAGARLSREGNPQGRGRAGRITGAQTWIWTEPLGPWEEAGWSLLRAIKTCHSVLRVLQSLLLFLPVLGELPEGYHVTYWSLDTGNMQSALFRLKKIPKLHVTSGKNRISDAHSVRFNIWVICVHETPHLPWHTMFCNLHNCITAISVTAVLGMISVLYKCEEKSVKISSKIFSHSYLSNCIFIVDFFLNLHFFMHSGVVKNRSWIYPVCFPIQKYYLVFYKCL